MPEDKTADEQQVAAEQATADSDEAKRAAEKRADALTRRDGKTTAPDDAKPKARKQTTRKH